MNQPPKYPVDEQPENPVGVSPENPSGVAPEQFDAIVEALLFVSGEALTLERIALILEVGTGDAKRGLDMMAGRLRNSGRGLLLREIAGKYQLCTRPELAAYVGRLFEVRQKQGLSQAAYETLSIVAYNANVTRALVEKIRGVNSDSPIEKLVERGLIAETGRANLPGRPLTYDVTDDFYRLFGFKSRGDLPDLSFELGGFTDGETDSNDENDEKELEIGGEENHTDG